MKDREHVLNRTAILVLVAICLYLGWQWHALAVITTAKSQSQTALLESQQHRVAEITALGGQTVLSLAMVLGAGVTILIAPFVVAHL